MTAPVSPRRHRVSGVCPPARAAVLDGLLCAHPAPVWLVVLAEARAAEQLTEDLVFMRAASG
ncbi:MAG: hypothetical protein ACK5CF_04680, partial [Opitutaceae bacterium]